MAKILQYSFIQELDDNGDPLAGGKLYTYEAGTSTPKATYTDASEGTQNANPVILDASGRASVWLGDGSYKLVLKDADDNLIAESDGVTGGIDGDPVSYDISTNTAITSGYQNARCYVTGTTTLSLLAAATAGAGFEIYVQNAGTGVATIDPDGAETINDAATLTLQGDEWAIVSCDGDEWYAFKEDKILPENNTFSGDNIFTGDNTFSGDNTFNGDVRFPDDGELTIASGVITVTGAYHTADTESDAASDDLHTISGGNDGQILILSPEHTDRTIVIKDGIGNINTRDGRDIELDSTDKTVTLLYSGALSAWVVLSEPPPVNNLVSDTIDTATGSTLIPEDGTTPLVSEGTEIATLNITPTSDSKEIRISASVSMYNDGGNTNIITLFRGSTCIGAAFHSDTSLNRPSTLSLNIIDSPATASQVTYSLRAGISLAGNWYVSRANGGTLNGEAAKQRLIAEEI